MSAKVVDERVVVLNFDNKKFEKNTKQTIKSINKLKKSMNFDEATESINKAYEDADPSKMSKALDIATKKWNVMEVAAISAINRITNKVMAAGEKLIKSLSVEPIMQGWSAYEEEVKSVGTLLGQGYDVSVVNKQLGLLSKYANATSYSYTDMTNNMSKFTAAGVDLDKATNAMMGIANWAALSGAGIQKASTAMYQLAQAIGAGTVKLQDWKSIQNVSMDTKEFRQQVLDTAVAMGTLKKAANNTYKTLNGKTFNINQFTTQLSEGWFTSDVLVATLEKYSSAVQEIFDIREREGVSIDEATRLYEKEIEKLEKKVKEFGDTSGETTKKINEMRMGLKAFLSAEEARTLTDAIKATADAVKSTWKDTAANIFGGYEEAKETWTSLSEDLIEIFADGRETFNKILKQWGDKSLVKNAEEATSIVNDLIAEIEPSNLSVDASKWDIFSKATGATKEYKSALIEAAFAAGALYKDQEGIMHAVDGTVVSVDNFEESLSSGWLTAKSLKGTLDQIANNPLGGREDLFGAKQYDKETGKYLAEASGAFWNLLEAIKAVIKTVKTAWTEVFGEKNAEGIKNITQRIQEFSAKLVPAEGIFERMKNILKGIFSIGNMIVKVVKGLLIGIKPIFSVFTKGGDGILSLTERIANKITGVVDGFDYVTFGNKIATVTTKIADALGWVIDKIKVLVKKALPYLKEFFKMVVKVFTALVGVFGLIIKKVFEFTRDLIIAIKESETFKKVLNALKTAAQAVYEFLKKLFSKFGEWVKSIKNSKFADIVRAGCKKIQDAFMAMFNKLKGVKADDKGDTGALSFLEKLKQKLQVFAPVLDGLKNLWTGIKNLFGPLMKLVGAAFTALGNFLSAVGERINGFLEGKNGLISLGELLKTTFKVGIAAILTKWVTSIIGAITKLVNSFSMFLTGFKGHSILERTALALKQFATAMLMFTAALIILSKLDSSQVGKAMVSIGLVLAAYVAFIKAIQKLFISNETMFNGTKFLFWSKGKSSTSGPAATISAISMLLLSLSASMLMISSVIKKLSGIDENKIDLAITVLVAVMGIMSVFLQELKKFIRTKNAKIVAPGLLTFIGITIVIKSMAKQMATLSKLNEDEILRGALALMVATTALTMILGSIQKISKSGKNALASGVKTVAILLSLTNLLSKLTKVFMEIAKMNWDQIKQGATGLAVMAGSLMVVLLAIKSMDKKGTKSAKKAVGVLLSLVLVFGIMTYVVKQMAGMPKEDFKNAMVSIISVAAIFGAIQILTKAINAFSKSGPGKSVTITKKFKGIFGALLGATLVILAFTLAINTIVSKIQNGTDLAKFVVVISALTLALTLIFLSFSELLKSAPQNKTSMSGMKFIKSLLAGMTVLIIGMAVSISIISKAIASTSYGAVITSLGMMLLTITGMLIGIGLLINKTKTMSEQKIIRLERLIKVIKNLMFAVSIVLLAVTLFTYGKNIAEVVLPLMGVMLILVGSVAALVALTRVIDERKVKVMIGIMVAVAALMVVFAKTLGILNSMETGNALTAMIVIAAVMAAFIALAAVLSPMATPIAVISAAFLAFGAALFLVATAMYELVLAAEKLNTLNLDADKIGQNLIAAAEGVSQAARAIGSAIAGVVVGVLEGIFDRVMELIQRILTYIGGIGYELGNILAKVIGGAFAGLAETDAMGSLADMFIDMIKVVVKRLPEICEELINTALRLLDLVIQKVPVLMVKLVTLAWEVIINFINALADSLVKNAERLRDAFAHLFESIIEMFKKMFGINSPSTLFQKFGEFIWKGLVNGLKGMWNGVKQIWDGFKQNVSQWWNGLINWFKDVGKNILNGLWNGLKQGWDNITGWFTDAGNWIKDTWRNIFGIHSPSKVFAQYGDYMVQGLEQGLEDTKGVADAVQNLGDTVTKEMENSDINTVLSNILSNIDSNLDDDLVIKPIMDLSEIQNGTNKINNMMSSLNGYEVRGDAGMTSELYSSVKSNKKQLSAAAVSNNTTNNDTVYNTFNITGTNAKEIADQVAAELQKQVDRRKTKWA